MNLTFAAQLNKMITAGLGGAVEAPDTGVAVGRRVEYTSIGPAPILTFEANSERPLKALSVNIEPIQEGSGDPSPENVRPISGRQSVTVWRSGVNVWDEEWESGFYNQQGDAVPSNTNIRSKNPISVVPNTEYFLKTAGVTIYICQYDASGRFIAEAGRQSATDAVFVTNVNARFIKFNLTTRYGTTYNHDISFNYPSTDHEYNPGTVASVEVQLGQTVYGGVLDVVAGKLYSEWANIASYDGEELPGEWLSSMDVYSEGATPTTGAQVCYKLAEPVELTLTPEQLSTLIGTNNVWSDANEVSLTYGNIYYTEGY